MGNNDNGGACGEALALPGGVLTGSGLARQSPLPVLLGTYLRNALHEGSAYPVASLELRLAYVFPPFSLLSSALQFRVLFSCKKVL
jgi:hypothetical protein